MLLDEQTSLDLVARTTAWGASAAEANEFLVGLPDDTQRRTTADWNHQACTQLDDVVRRCFPNARSREEIPSELWEILNGPDGWSNGTLGARVALVPALQRTLASHLAQHETFDSLQQQQIASQRAERNAALERAREGLGEAESTARAHRASLADGIKSRLRLVSAEFDRLDQQYGGYGAKLEYPEPDPPAEPDKPWKWTVTPKWRRSEGGPFSAFNVKGNTAQMDEKAVKLVCAAALAGGSDRPLLLILDELGRNLGSQHRREAVALFEQIGRDRNITVIGALQDDMERYALASSRLYVKLRRSSDTMAYNQAPVVKGNEEYAARVELLKTWLDSYRGPTPTLDLPPDQLPTDPVTTAAPNTPAPPASAGSRVSAAPQAQASSGDATSSTNSADAASAPAASPAASQATPLPDAATAPATKPRASRKSRRKSTDDSEGSTD